MSSGSGLPQGPVPFRKGNKRRMLERERERALALSTLDQKIKAAGIKQIKCDRGTTWSISRPTWGQGEREGESGVAAGAGAHSRQQMKAAKLKGTQQALPSIKGTGAFLFIRYWHAKTATKPHLRQFTIHTSNKHNNSCHVGWAAAKSYHI